MLRNTMRLEGLQERVRAADGHVTDVRDRLERTLTPLSNPRETA